MIGTLESLSGKREKLVIGLISGTSMDGIDSALVRITGSGPASSTELIEFVCVPYSTEITRRLDRINRACSPGEISALNFLIGDAFAGAAQAVTGKAGVSMDEVDLIGSHGQTVSHNPPSYKNGAASTLQIGELDVIAERTGVTTVGDFRTRDLAAGGEGAPLVPYADYVLFMKPGQVRIAQNIGGIANATIITEDIDAVTAFDTGPGNMLLDRIAFIASDGKERFDRDGRAASRGIVDEPLLRDLLSDPYFLKPPPKSTGEELFGKERAEGLYGLVSRGEISLNDLMATLVMLTLESICLSYERFVFPKWNISEVILSGGGCKNPLFTEGLRKRLGHLKISTTDDYGITGDAKEAVAFAILANELISGNCANFPSVTGASGRVPMGKISLGGNPGRGLSV